MYSPYHASHLGGKHWRMCKLAGDNLALSDIEALNPLLIILSGVPHSVHVPGSQGPDGFFDFSQRASVTVLGICYGLHLIVKLLGGTVERADCQGYGRMTITVDTTTDSKLYAN